MPETPVTPAAPAAGSAPSTSSAPASTPALVSTPAGDGQSTPITPDTSSQAPAGEGSAAPAGEGAGEQQQKGREPQQSDYPGDIEKYLEAKYAWERGEDNALTEAPPEGTAKTEDELPEGEQKPEVKAEPDEDDEDVALEEDVQAPDTPEAMQSLIEQTPGAKELFSAHPSFRNKVFEMARQNARLAPMGQLFPDMASAQYANDTADKFVGLQTGIMSAVDRPTMLPAIQQFAQEFQILDADGKPVLDAQGQPTYSPDLDLFWETGAHGWISSKVEKLKAAIAGKVYEGAQLEEAETQQQAFEYVLTLLGESDEGEPKPDRSGWPEAARREIEAREAEVERKEQELGIKRAASKKEELKAQRASADRQFTEEYGKSFAGMIGNFLEEREKQGAFIPSFIKEYTVDDGHGGKIPLFGKNVAEAYQKRIASVPAYKARLAELQLAPPTPQNIQKRIEYVKSLIDSELPAIMKNELSKFQKQEKADRDARRQRRETGRKDARQEPQSSGQIPSATEGMSEDEAARLSNEMVQRDFSHLSGAERIVKAMELRHNLMRKGSA